MFFKQFSDYDVAFQPFILAEILVSAVFQNIPVYFHDDLTNEISFHLLRVLFTVVNNLVIYTLVLWPT